MFIFQSHSTLTTADGAPSPAAHTRILLTNGAKASNVWWQVASSATIGSYSDSGQHTGCLQYHDEDPRNGLWQIDGRPWTAGAGAFTFDSNVVSVPGSCPL